MAKAKTPPIIQPLAGVSLEWLETLDEKGYKIVDLRDPLNPTTRFYPSVSTIQGEVQSGFGFGAWKEEQAANLGVEGARLDGLVRMKLGSNVHKLIERYLHGDEVSWTEDGTANSRKLWDDREWKAFMRWIRWFQAEPTKVLASEFTVFSHTYRYAGTLDCILERSGKVGIYDWKHSQATNPSHYRQIAAYRHAVMEMFPTLDVETASVVALNARTKTGVTEKTLDGPECDDHFGRFLNLMQVFTDEHPDFDADVVALPTKITPVHDTTNLFPVLTSIIKEIT